MLISREEDTLQLEQLVKRMAVDTPPIQGVTVKRRVRVKSNGLTEVHQWVILKEPPKVGGAVPDGTR